MNAEAMHEGYFRRACFRVGEWIVVPATHRLIRGDHAERIEPKAMQVLVCLAERTGEIVTKDELLQTVWRRVHVGDKVVTRAVLLLRRAFGDNPQRPEVIATVPYVGYRLVAPVVGSSGPSGDRFRVPAGGTGSRPIHAIRLVLAAGVGAITTITIWMAFCTFGPR